MKKDPTEFRQRFAAWKNGEKVYKDGLPAYRGGKQVLNNYTNAEFNDDGTFTDDTTRMFDDFYVTPSGVKTKYGSYTDKNWDRYKQQERFFKTHDQQTGKFKYEPGLEIVSPEFDLLTLGTGARTNAATQTFQKNRKIANAISKEIKENAIITGYNRNPVTKELGTLWDYQNYLDNVFPNSKIKDVLWHGSAKKNLQSFSPEYIGSNAPIKKSVGMYLSPEKTTAANYVRKGDIYPVLLNTENPFITNQFLGGFSKNGINVTKISPKTRSTILANNDAVIAPLRSEIAFFNPDDALILGSQSDRNQFAGFMQRLNRKAKIQDGYVYKNNTVTPGEHKYYGQKINYSDPNINELSDYQLDDMMGDYVGRGAERTVYQDLRNNNRLLKITDGGSPDVQITNQSDLLDYIEESLRINKLPEVPQIAYEGFIKDGDRFLPVFSQQKVTPMKKVADPFQVFTKQYVLPNGKTPSGKLSAIRKMNPDAFSRIGYKPITSKPGVYSVNGTDGNYNVTDLGQKNVGIDALGNLKIFDPMFE